MDDKEADQVPNLSEKKRIHLGVLTIFVLLLALVAMDPSPVIKAFRKIPGNYWTCESLRICGGIPIGAMESYECAHGKRDLTSCTPDATPIYKDPHADVEKLYHGNAINKEDQSFEDLIAKLLLISTDDVARGFVGAVTIDMAGRKKYFSPSGWDQYQQFVLKQKELLKLKYPTAKFITAKAHFNSDSQEYSKTDQGTLFSAEGSFCYGTYDEYSCKGEFKITTRILSGEIKKPENIVLDEWAVQKRY